MKKSIFLGLLVFLYSCKKDNEVMSTKQLIIGTWEFERFVGYPFNQPALPPGNGRIIVIGKNRLFERKRHDTLLFSGSYSVLKKKDCYERNSEVIFLTNENSSGDYQYIETVDEKLLLSTPNCYQDGGTAYYRRLR